MNSPAVPDIRNKRNPSVRLATITVIPTRSCDHFSCFWLGKGFPHDASWDWLQDCGEGLNRRILPEHPIAAS